MSVTTDPPQPRHGLEGQESLAWHSGPCSMEPELPFKAPFPQPLTVLPGLVPPPFASAVPATWSAFPYFSLLCQSWPVLPGFFLRLSLKVRTKGLPSGNYNWSQFSTKYFAGVSLDSPLRVIWELAKLDLAQSSGQEEWGRS